MIIKGFKICAGNIVAKLAPPAANINTNGNNLSTIFKSTLPERINLIALVSDPNELANLLVPSANEGGIPIANKAGVEIRPPPPTTASIKAAKNPNAIIINIIFSVISMMHIPFVLNT